MPPPLFSRLQALFERLIQNQVIRRIIKNSGYLFSASGLAYGMNMVQGILVARLIGLEGVGVVGIITQFATVINNLASFRMSELVVKFVGHYQEQQELQTAAAVFKAAGLTELLASLVAFTAYWLVTPFAAQFFLGDVTSPHKTAWILIYGAGAILGNIVFESATGLLQVFDRFRRIAGITVVQSGFTLSFIAIAFFTNGDILTVLLAYMGGKILAASGITFFALKEAKRTWGRGWWRTPLGVLRPQIRTLARFAISTNLSGTLSLITKGSELLWISAFRQSFEAGYYKYALALANLVLLPVSHLPKATYPELSREVSRRNWKNLRYILRQSSKLAGGYTLLSSLGLVIFGRLALRLLYGPDFLPAYPALMIILIGLLVANTFYWARPALLSFGLADYATKVNVGVTILKVAGALILLPRLGYIGSAILLTATYIFGITLSTLKVRSLVRRFERTPVAAA